jgi:hypothetical protein
MPRLHYAGRSWDITIDDASLIYERLKPGLRESGWVNFVSGREHLSILVTPGVDLVLADFEPPAADDGE